MSNSKIHIAIAEDNHIAVKSITEKLSHYDDIVIDLIAHNGNALLKEALLTDIDLILMDLDMPILNGIDTTKKVKQLYPKIKILVLTTFDDDVKIFDAIMAGANGYLLKEEPKDIVYRSIKETFEGGAAMSAIIALKALNLIRNPYQHSNKTPIDFGLTQREVEVLEYLKNGLTYEQLANNMFISVGTIRKHVENIYRKLQVNNKVSAVKVASDNRII